VVFGGLDNGAPIRVTQSPVSNYRVIGVVAQLIDRVTGRGTRSY